MFFDTNIQNEFLSELPKLKPDEYLSLGKSKYSIKKAASESEAFQKVISEVVKHLNQLHLQSESAKLTVLKKTYENIIQFKASLNKYSFSLTKFFEQNAVNQSVISIEENKMQKLWKIANAIEKKVIVQAKKVRSLNIPQQDVGTTKKVKDLQISQKKEEKAKIDVKLDQIRGTVLATMTRQITEAVLDTRMLFAKEMDNLDKVKLKGATTEEKQKELAQEPVKRISEFLRTKFLKVMLHALTQQMGPLQSEMGIKEKEWATIGQTQWEALEKEFNKELHAQVEEFVVSEIAGKRADLEFLSLLDETETTYPNQIKELTEQLTELKKKVKDFTDGIKYMPPKDINSPSKEPILSAWEKEQINKLNERISFSEQKIAKAQRRYQRAKSTMQSQELMHIFHGILSDFQTFPIKSLKGSSDLHSLNFLIKDIQDNAVGSPQLLNAAKDFEYMRQVFIETRLRYPNDTQFKELAQRICADILRLPEKVDKNDIAPCVTISGGYFPHTVKFMFQRNGSQFSLRIINPGEGGDLVMPQGDFSNAFFNDSIYSSLSMNQISAEIIAQLLKMSVTELKEMDIIYRYIEQHFKSTGGYVFLSVPVSLIQLGQNCVEASSMAFLSIRAPNEFKQYYEGMVKRLFDQVKKEIQLHSHKVRWQLLVFGTTSKERIDYLMQQIFDRANQLLQTLASLKQSAKGMKSP